MRRGSKLRGFRWIALAALSGLVASGVARADESTAKARAKKLFEEGMRAIDRHDKVTGCEKLRESLAIFAVPNTLFNVAECDEHDGKFALAYEHWQRGTALLDAKDARIPVAQKRLEALEKRIARLRLVVPPKIASATIVLDGVEMAAAALSEPIVVDVGAHVIVTKVPDHEDHRQDVNLAARDRTEIVVRAGAAKKTAAQKDHEEHRSKLQTGAWVSLGIGTAGAIAAGISGSVLLSRDKQISDHCTNYLCDPTGYDLAQGQGPLLVTNAVAWGVGAAGIGAGAVLLILWKRAETAEASAVLPLVTPNFGGLGVTGRF